MKKFAVFAISLVAIVAQASELPSTKPEKVGLSSERLQKISEFTQRAIDEGRHSGFVTMVARLIKRSFL